MPSPRRRSRDRRSRSRSPQRRPPRRSRSRSPRRRPTSRSSRSRSRSLKRRSPRRSRTHSPRRRPIRRSRSRSGSRNRRSFSPRRRRSISPRGRPPGGRSPSPRGRPQGRRSPSPRGRPQGRRFPSPRGRPQGSRSPIRSPQIRKSRPDDNRRRQSPHSSTDQRRNKSRSRSPHAELPPLAKSSSRSGYRGRSHSPSTGKTSSSGIHHKSGFISGITVVTPIRRLLLSDRFETEEQRQQGDIAIEDNIVIAIQRGPHVRNTSPVEINREFDSNHVVIMRRPDEGEKAIFDREEIKVFGFDSILDENVYEERRIISVVPSASQSSSRRRRSPEVIRKVKQGPEIKLDFRPDPRYETLMKAEGKGDNYLEETRIKRVEKNPNDLRHSLSNRHQEDTGFDARKKIEAKRKGSDSVRKEGGQVFERIGDRSRERRRDSSRERRPTSGRDRDSRRPSGNRQDRSEKLPDFKNRPDKFQYDEWKEKPEMIPRNPSYFEHDNREGERGFRGRGRGRGFRGRPPPRGRGRGFRGTSRGGYTGSREKESAWKHDLFDKLNEEEEEKPSSTTKN